MIRFMIVDNEQLTKNKLALVLKKASKSVQQYPFIIELDVCSIYDVTDWNRYDAAFVRINGTKKVLQEFECLDYIRKQNKHMLIIFYSEKLENDFAIQLYDYFPVSYLPIPLNIDQVTKAVRVINDSHNPLRIYIEYDQVWTIQKVSDISCYDMLDNVIYTKERSIKTTKEIKYQKYITKALKLEGFFCWKDRYLINPTI